jgi:hypothetical protein
MESIQLDHISRLYRNISVLLARGVFAGQDAEAIAEAQSFVKGILNDIEAKQAAGSSVGNEADAVGVGGSEVPPAKRKGRKGRSNPA